MRLQLVLAAPLLATLLASCSSVLAVPVQRHPDASLLLDCTDPILQANPDVPGKSFDNDFAADSLRVLQAYQECKQLNADKAKFLRGAEVKK
jgi:hypothetical protein